MSDLPTPALIKKVLHGVVQIVALKKGRMGNVSSLWTGSGTIVDPRGIILTNCHVANPRALGMSAPDADMLGISITNRSDEPPALTYLAEIVVLSPELDLAVLKIVSETNGKRVRSLRLPSVPIGDSDKIDLGDTMAIFGYPGIGGETVTFTSGSVAGFSKEPSANIRRGWIKTDATIAGGNSGGTAVDKNGYLVGIPTQAAAGTGITPVDARPVVDTNRDGRVDSRDTPMAIGGFINGLRPINLAKPLLRKAGVKVTGAGSRTKVPMRPTAVKKRPTSKGVNRVGHGRARAGSSGGQTSSTKSTKKATSYSKTRGPRLTNIAFSTRVSRDGRPIHPTSRIPAGAKALYVTFDFAGMRNGSRWGQSWALNGKQIINNEDKWSDGGNGRKTLSLSNKQPLPEGEYLWALHFRGQVVGEATAVVGRKVDDSDSEISGQIVDNRTGRGIKDALVIALKPGVRVMDFVRHQSKSMAYTSSRTNKSGHFTLKEQLPKGQAYGLVVVARGYKDLVVESGLRVGPTTPEQANMQAVQLQRE